MATVDDGFAIIDEGHAVGWLTQTAAQTWIGIDCASPVLNECVGFASGLTSSVVRINTLDARQSTVQTPVPIDLLWASMSMSPVAMTGPVWFISPRSGWFETPLTGDSFTVLVPEDAAAVGRNCRSWPVRHLGTGLHRGFIITDFRQCHQIHPAVEEVEMNIIDVLVLGALSMFPLPGVILGLIYMNSPWMQRKYREWRFGKK